jgi:hypothetical protein
MKLSDYLEVFVPTHIVNADSNPYIENRMIEQTIRSCHESLGFEDVQFTIGPDARFKKSHPKLMVKYENYLNDMCDMLKKDGINAVVKKENGETLRGNWIKFVNECKKPYMFFLEHDWKFIRNINVKDIIKSLEEEKSINYLRLSRFDLTESYYNNMCSASNWDWVCIEAKELKTKIPLTRISFFSGNPHFARTSFCKDFIVPNLNKYCPIEKAKGASHLEKDIKKAEMYMIDEMRDCGFSNKSTDGDKAWGHQWPLSLGPHIGKGCQKCADAICKQHVIWGNFIYGHKGEKAIVAHLGDWCMKC